MRPIARPLESVLWNSCQMEMHCVQVFICILLLVYHLDLSNLENNKCILEKLGAVEIIHVNRNTTLKYSRQPFDYLLVLDFEATCWDKLEYDKGYSEIIEFPCVLYDLRKCEVLEEFQQYVMPTERPKLSDFCKQLTGIQQYQVDRGVPLGTCLMLFNKWLKEQMQKYNFSLESSQNKKCIFATWSDWDLGKCFKNECKRKGIERSPIFCRWIDIRILYVDHYLRRPKGLSGALSEVGLKFEGNEHCGLDDAKNTARLVGKMIEDGVLLRVTKEIRSF